MYDEGSTKEGRTKEEGPGTETLLLEGGPLRRLCGPLPRPFPSIRSRVLLQLQRHYTESRKRFTVRKPADPRGPS